MVSIFDGSMVTVLQSTISEDAVVIERREWGNMHGFIKAIYLSDKTLTDKASLWPALQQQIKSTNAVFEEIRHIEKNLIGAINYKMERLRLKERGLEIENKKTEAAMSEINQQRSDLQQTYDGYTQQLTSLYEQLNKNTFEVSLVNGQKKKVPFSTVVRAYQPNSMSIISKLGFYAEKFWEFLSDDPREANTEGGIFPCYFSVQY